VNSLTIAINMLSIGISGIAVGITIGARREMKKNKYKFNPVDYYTKNFILELKKNIKDI